MYSKGPLYLDEPGINSYVTNVYHIALTNRAGRFKWHLWHIRGCQHVQNNDWLASPLLDQLIVHLCSDGVGRTGAFISAHAEMERMKAETVVDLFQFIKGMRIQRAGMVSNKVRIYVEFIRQKEASLGHCRTPHWQIYKELVSGSLLPLPKMLCVRGGQVLGKAIT